MEFGDARSVSQLVKNLDSFGQVIGSALTVEEKTEGLRIFEEGKLKESNMVGRAVLITRVADKISPEKILFYGILQRVVDKQGPIHTGKGTMVDQSFLPATIATCSHPDEPITTILEYSH